MIIKPQPWSCADATDMIRRLAVDQRLCLSKSVHFDDQLSDRDLIMGDALYVLKNGFVYREAQTSTQPGLFKYRIDSMTPNAVRTVRIVAIPDPQRCWMKLVTVMWVDEDR
jgi:hypothetical protein